MTAAGFTRADRWLVCTVVASFTILILCALIIGYAPNLFRLGNADHVAYMTVLYYVTLWCPVVGVFAAVMLTAVRHWWWILVAALLGLFGGAVFVLGGLWIAGGVRI